MTLPPTIRRLESGAIDYDFYRRGAARKRSIAQRRVIRHGLRAAFKAVRAAFSALTSRPSPQPSLRRLRLESCDGT